MDIFYAVKQLVHEIEVHEAQLVEKKTALGKLWPALSLQEQLLFHSPSAPQPEPPAQPESAPAESKKSKKSSFDVPN